MPSLQSYYYSQQIFGEQTSRILEKSPQGFISSSLNSLLQTKFDFNLQKFFVLFRQLAFAVAQNDVITISLLKNGLEKPRKFKEDGFSISMQQVLGYKLRDLFIMTKSCTFQVTVCLESNDTDLNLHSSFLGFFQVIDVFFL